MAANSGRIAGDNVCASDQFPDTEQTRRGEVSHARGKSADRRPTAARRPSEGGGAIHFCGAHSDSSESSAPCLYWFCQRLWHLHVQLLASADTEVSIG